MDDQETKLPQLPIIMGSQSDWDTMKFAEKTLVDKLKIPVNY